MSGALTMMNENLSTDDIDSHRFFFSLRTLRLCGSLFVGESLSWLNERVMKYRSVD